MKTKKNMATLNNLPDTYLINKFRTHLWIGNKKIQLDDIIDKKLINRELKRFNYVYVYMNNSPEIFEIICDLRLLKIIIKDFKKSKKLNT